MSDTIGMDALRQDLMLDEGTQLFPYIDTAGNTTIGVGRNLSGHGISFAEANTMLDNDIADAIHGLDATLAWWRGLPAQQQRVMVNLCFNMGIGTLRGFPKFLAAMHDRDWPQAQAELKNSLWFTEVGQRGPRMLERLGEPAAVPPPAIVIAASAVSRAAGNDPKVCQAFEAALSACGYLYNINTDSWFKR